MEIKDVENLAELARIELTKEEKEQILEDMNGILGYVKTIEEIKIEEKDKKLDIYNIWREDKIEEKDFSKESIIGQFPEKKDNFLKVKKIL